MAAVRAMRSRSWSRKRAPTVAIDAKFSIPFTVAVALVQMGAMRTVTHELAGNWLPSVEVANQMNQDLTNFRIKEYRHIVNSDEAHMSIVEREQADVLATYRTHEQGYAKLISSSEEQHIFDAYVAELKTPNRSSAIS